MRSNYQTKLVERRLETAVNKHWPHIMQSRVMTALRAELESEIEANAPGEFKDGYRRGLARALVIAMRESKRELWDEGSHSLGIRNPKRGEG